MSDRLCLARLDALDRRFDGPVPPFDPAAPPPPLGRARLFQRLAADRRGDIAVRRAGLAAERVTADEALGRAGRHLAYYRHQGVAWLALIGD